jgi:hypothetical protein
MGILGNTTSVPRRVMVGVGMGMGMGMGRKCLQQHSGRVLRRVFRVGELDEEFRQNLRQ